MATPDNCVPRKPRGRLRWIPPALPSAPRVSWWWPTRVAVRSTGSTPTGPSRSWRDETRAAKGCAVLAATAARPPRRAWTTQWAWRSDLVALSGSPTAAAFGSSAVRDGDPAYRSREGPVHRTLWVLATNIVAGGGSDERTPEGR